MKTDKNLPESLSLFHHLHHIKGEHEAHHCGGRHKKIDPELDFTIKHCACGKHAINKKTAIGHATSRFLKPVKVKIEFIEKCPGGGWHIESGILAAKREKPQKYSAS